MPDKRRKEATERIEGPTIEQQDWDAIQSGEPVPERIPGNGDVRYDPTEEPKPGELPEEDDDNPYQESDEALPDDAEEAAIKRNPSKQKPRFDEV